MASPGFDIQQITNIPARHWGIAFTFYMGFVCSGILVLLRFRPDFIHDLDVLKLILVGSSIVMPVYIWNFLIIVPIMMFQTITTDLKDDNNFWGPSLTLAAIASFATLNASLVLSYLLHLSFRGFFWLAIIIQIIFSIWAFKKGKSFIKRSPINDSGPS